VLASLKRYFARARTRALRLGSLLLTRTPLRLSLFLLLAWICALPVIAQAAGMNKFHDAQFLSAYERHARWTVLQFGQLPFWDPYSCGGMYGLAAPQTRYTSPLFLFSLTLGVDRASALFAVLWPAFAMEGMFRYARSWGASARAALLCAPLFPLSGFFATAWYVGWVQFLSFCGLPWILVGLRGALRGSRPHAYLCGVSCLLTVGFGGTWTLPMGAPLCAFEVLDALLVSRAELRAVGRVGYGSLLARRARLVAVGLSLCALWVLSIGALRLWPMLESVQATLRVMGGDPTPEVQDLLAQLLTITKGGDNHDQGAYYVAPIVLLSVFALPAKRAWLLWLAAIAFAALSLGHISEDAPFALLRKLPVYDTMRYPERFLVELAIVLSVLFARALTSWLALARRRNGRRGAQRALGAFAVLAGLGVASQAYNVRAVSSDVELEPSPTFHSGAFRQSRGNRWLMSHFAAEGMGSLACGEAYPVPMSRRLRGDLKREEYVIPEPGGAVHGEVQRLAWSPNEVSLRVSAERPVRIAINQNYHPGWRAEGGQVESWDGLLSVRVPAGESRVRVRFSPRSGIGGLCVTLLSLVAGALWARRRQARSAVTLARGPARFDRRDVALAALGPSLWLLLMLVWPEQPWRALEPTISVALAGDGRTLAPDLAPVYLPAVPVDAIPMEVSFDVPIKLEGARFSPVGMRDGRRHIDIDLYLRRSGELSPDLGLFVFLRPRGKRSEHGDHSTVSGVVYLPRLRLGQLARDAFRVAVPDNSIGTWEVRVGFWNQYSDQTRRHVTKSRGVKVIDNAVVVGRFEVFE
jgi:hypothetical protein